MYVPILFIYYYSPLQIVNCLHEWSLGHLTKTAFIGNRYESVYEAMICLIEKIEENDYHGDKLQALLKGVAKDGRLV